MADASVCPTVAVPTPQFLPLDPWYGHLQDTGPDSVPGLGWCCFWVQVRAAPCGLEGGSACLTPFPVTWVSHVRPPRALLSTSLQIGWHNGSAGF
jgi:hypothetical protein